MSIRWSEDFNTGIEVIDDHHEGMFERINDLLDALDRGDTVASIKHTIIFFESFIASHFTLEEMLMQKFDYQDFPIHSRQHAWLKEYFSALKPLIEAKGTSPNSATATRNFINGWWNSYITHLNTFDKHLAEFLKNKNVLK